MSSELISNAIAKWSDIRMEFLYSILHNSSNIGTPNPLNQGAKDNKQLSVISVIKIPRVIATINSVRITSSTFFNSLPMHGIVLI